VYLDVTHLSATTIEEKLPVMLEQFLKFGVDIRREPMEVAPTAHHFMGGLRITPDCATTIPGLFACGEVAGGLHGANRLGGNALAETQVFGKRAGEAAGKSRDRARSVDRRTLEKQAARFAAFRKGSAQAQAVARKLRAAMWHGAGIFRTARDLEDTLEQVTACAAEPLQARTASNLAECCTVENMCLVASLVVRCALLRAESRGAHVRRDVHQSWEAATSPFGHTYVSMKRSGIERKGCADAAD
jgi:fumarate reductase (CoM/CoB) subunit A